MSIMVVQISQIHWFSFVAAVNIDCIHFNISCQKYYVNIWAMFSAVASILSFFLCIRHTVSDCEVCVSDRCSFF